MMLPRFQQVAVIPVTVKRLRNLADDLERRWKAAKLGEDVPSIVWTGMDMDVRFVIDQDEQYAEDRRAREAGRMT